jgi:hypothetical protein
MGALGTWLVSLAGPAAAKILAALGVGIVSYAALSTALAAALSAAKSAWGGLTGDALALIQMSGASTALSIVCGAILARLALLAVKRFEVLA